MATLKESYGFIESEEHDCELFFPFRSVNLYTLYSRTSRQVLYMCVVYTTLDIALITSHALFMYTCAKRYNELLADLKVSM